MYFSKSFKEFETYKLNTWSVQGNSKIRLKIGIDSGNIVPFQVRWNGRIRNNFK
jgi:hypothetical protein